MFEFVVEKVRPDFTDCERANIFESCEWCEKSFFWIFWFDTEMTLVEAKIGDVILERRRRRQEVEIWDGAHVVEADGFEFCELADGVERREGTETPSNHVLIFVYVWRIVVSTFNPQGFQFWI